MTLSPRGTHANLGVPGTGVSWRGRIDGGTGRNGPAAKRTASAVACTPTPPHAASDDAGKTELDSALTMARMRRPFGDAFAAAQDRVDLPSIAPVRKQNLILEGRIGRGQFLLLFLVLAGLAFLMTTLWDNYPREVSDGVMTLGMLAIAALGLLLVACRSRAAGLPPWVTFLGIAVFAYPMPWVPVVILGLLLILPNETRTDP